MMTCRACAYGWAHENLIIRVAASLAVNEDTPWQMFFMLELFQLKEVRSLTCSCLEARPVERCEVEIKASRPTLKITQAGKGLPAHYLGIG